MSTLRINLWSGPRNISTALMYAFAQRSDTQVCDEPLYAHYLRVTDAPHPGKEEIIASMNEDSKQVIDEVILGRCDKPILFMKQMAHHLVEVDHTFFSQTANVLLTRDPVDMLPSLVKNLPNATITDTGYAVLSQLYTELQAVGQEPPVIESKEVLKDPRGVLSQLCERLDIPFDEAMLSWPVGPRPEDGVWAKYWYHNVHNSTKFQPYQPKKEPFPPHLRPLLEICQPHYDQLAKVAIRA